MSATSSTVITGAERQKPPAPRRAPKYPGIHVTCNGNQLVTEHVEARITEGGVFYPITPSTEGGEIYQQSYAMGELNVFGQQKIAIECEGEHAAQGGATAFSVAGRRTVNFTSGQGIVYAMEQYYHAPGKLCTMVLEVGARALTKHALNVHCGHDDFYAALDTGWTMLMAKDAQQAGDQAIILRKLNELSLNPGMMEQCYAEFGQLTGRHYGLITEYRTEDADTVFVSLGCAAENIDAACDYLREQRNAKVGSIHINVIRPFPEAAVINALRGKKNVIIIERTDEGLAGDNPLARDIRVALGKALEAERYGGALPGITIEETPRLFRGSYGIGSRDFRPEHALGAYEFAIGQTRRKDGKSAAEGVTYFTLGIDHPYAVISKDTPSLLPDKAIAVRFHSIGGWGMVTTRNNRRSV